MIRREDFIKAIGQPDAGFTEAVDSALAVIRAREERKKPRRYHMILPVAAAAVIFFVFMGAALRGGFAPKQPGSGVLAQPETAAQKMTQAPVTFTPSPAPAETPQPTLEAEMAYATLPPDNEVYPTAAPYEAEDVPEPEEIPYNEAAHYDWPELTLDDAEETYPEAEDDYGRDDYKLKQAQHSWQAAQYTYNASATLLRYDAQVLHKTGATDTDYFTDVCSSIRGSSIGC